MKTQIPTAVTVLLLGAFAAAQAPAPAQPRLKVFVSVDMEGIGGIGTSAMTNATGKDYATGRRLMTDEVNAVVAALFAGGATEVVVNDSHGDMQNLLHTELDPRVAYIQGAVKPNGMVEGLDATFGAVVLLGAHARAGTPQGFIAHTGTGSVKGLWLNDIEVGEGELNAAFAGALGVPVVLAAGDATFVAQFTKTVQAETVVTKTAITPQSAMLRHPTEVQKDLSAAATRALRNLASYKAWTVRTPIEVRLKLDEPTRPQILTAIPGVRQIDGYTVAFTATDMAEAYRLIRLMYRFVTI